MSLRDPDTGAQLQFAKLTLRIQKARLETPPRLLQQALTTPPTFSPAPGVTFSPAAPVAIGSSARCDEDTGAVNAPPKSCKVSDRI